METEVVMQRVLFDTPISQKSKSEFFSATDLARAGNKWRLMNDLEPFQLKSYFSTKSAKEFIAELEQKYGKVRIASKGKGHHTWVHPLLFLDIALSINPKLKLEVYEWLYDLLLEYRNDSGDSYKEMCGSLFKHQTNKTFFAKDIANLANRIKSICGVKDWQSATEEQLKKRDLIHKNIALLSNVLKNNERAIEYGIREATKQQGESND